MLCSTGERLRSEYVKACDAWGNHLKSGGNQAKIAAFEDEHFAALLEFCKHRAACSHCSQSQVSTE
jgi:hypothetical protein